MTSANVFPLSFFSRMKATLKVSLAFRSCIWLNLMPQLQSPWCNPVSLIRFLKMLVSLVTRSHKSAHQQIKILLHDPNTALFDATWNHRSMIGKLNSLTQNTHPDILMAIHMCARYVNNPNWTHQDAVKYLCCYLHFSRNHGLILLKPTSDNCLNAYVDSDFARQWSHATSQLWDSAISHTGYVIIYCGCPIHWVSKLQSQITLSTTEAEYIALSMCLHDLLPMCTLLSKLTRHYDFRIPPDAVLTQQSQIDTCMYKSTVYEDNTGCLELVNCPDQYRLRT